MLNAPLKGLVGCGLKYRQQGVLVVLPRVVEMAEHVLQNRGYALSLTIALQMI